MWKEEDTLVRKKSNAFLDRAAMLKRKTKAYAKSIRALYRALALVFIR